MKILLTIVLLLLFVTTMICLGCCMVLSGRLSEREEAEYAAYKARLQST